MNYEYLEEEATADLAIKATGKSLKQAFENIALGLMNAIVETKSVDEQEIKYISVQSDDLKSLLYDFLEEILFFHDSEGIVFKNLEINELDEKNNSIKATLNGEIFDKNKHTPVNNVKAITYFGMKIEKLKSGFEIKVTVDL